MTLGENIWTLCVCQLDWQRFDEHMLAALGKLVIAAIDGCWEDLERDRAAEIAAMEDEHGNLSR